MITFEDVPETRYNSAYRNPNDAETLRYDERILNEKARYDGDRIAAVAAESLQAATEAVHAIEVEYEPLAVVTDPVEALERGAPVASPAPGNLAAEAEGGSSTATPTAPGKRPRSESRGRSHRRGPARESSSRRRRSRSSSPTAWWSFGRPPRCRFTSARSFRLPSAFPNRRICASLLRTWAVERGQYDSGRRVRGGSACSADRTPSEARRRAPEQFTSTRVRHAAVVESGLAAKRDGTLVARRTRATIATGGYATMPATASCCHWAFDRRRCTFPTFAIRAGSVIRTHR